MGVTGIDEVLIADSVDGDPAAICDVLGATATECLVRDLRGNRCLR